MESEDQRELRNDGKYYLGASNVQDLASKSLKEIPHGFLRQESQIIDQVSIEESLHVPVIDMTKLLHDLQNNASKCELEKLHLACKEWGLFQLINHGVPEDVIEKIKMDVDEFFKLPLEKKQASQWVPTKGQGYGPSSLSSKEANLDWGDFLYFITNPISLTFMPLWPTEPTSFRDSLERYSKELEKVRRCIFKSMSTNLGLNPETLCNKFENGRHGMRMNYYPPCVQCNKVIGFKPHFDINGLTIVLEANHVQGLQYKKNGKWVPIKPLPGALIVSNGDTIETMTNGEYKSVAHRVVVDPKKCRISIVALCGPPTETMIGPLAELVSEENKAKFKDISYGDYVKLFKKFSNCEEIRIIDHLRILEE